MTRSEQVAEELAAFERFRATHRILLGCLVRPQSPPEPDLAVTTAVGEIGIELTELVPGAFQRSVESAQDRTLRRAEELFTARGGPPTWVTLYWRHGAGPRRPDPELASWIAHEILGNLPPTSGHVIMDSAEPGAFPMDHPLIARVDIHRFADEAVSGWSSPRHWWPGMVGPSVLQSCIDSKNPKRALYVCSYSSAWLLITAVEAPSSGVMLKPSVFEHEFRSSFDRVFLAAYADSKVGELCVRPTS